ncbi:NRDE family protein [Ideonella sp.]|uniref:NRDE family protein n=1 Tax=Ideonella sp. TaxID=1929293 RepID=UPI002B47390D|nr:NRDE family protein [Ideonella sp.]HJV69096.1 NRDE family protein [Ideonella sp.]
MCLAALALDASRRFPLVVAANRDEFFHRAAAHLAWWTPDGGSQPILGGRDLAAGGTWMGLTASGRFALVTNVRRPGVALLGDGPSRGLIVPAWLQGQLPADRFWAETALSGFAPFNLIAADFRRGECFWASSQHASGCRLERGVTVISNAAEIDAPWPKVQLLKARVDSALQEADDTTGVEALAGQLFAMLADRTPAADEHLPHTGLDRERERLLSPAFIRTPDGAYGTRCSTLVITERAAKRLTTHVFERSFASGAGPALLRRAALKDWPPKYEADEAPASSTGPSPAPAWGTVDDSQLAEVPLDAPKKRRVRSLIRPLR